MNVWLEKSEQGLAQLFYGIVAETNKSKCISQYLPRKKNVG